MPETDYYDSVYEIRYALARQEDEARRIRRLLLEEVETGPLSQREIARRIGVNYRTMTHWLQAAREERAHPQQG